MSEASGKCPTSSPANKDGKKLRGDECIVCSEPVSTDVLECLWCEGQQHASCSKLNFEQCNVIGDLLTPNIVFFAPPVFKCFLSLYDIMTIKCLSNPE